MVREICDSFRFDDDLFHLKEPNTRYITFEYKTNNTNDERVMELIYELLNREQKRCNNCTHYQEDGYFCGYSAHFCDIRGNIEWMGHPNYDGDGNKCEDYKHKEEIK